jgi:membrane-associated HD superfamily phosphohydrolase
MKKYLVSAFTLVAVLGSSVAPALADEGGGIRDFFRRFRSERTEDRQENRDDRRENRDELASKSQELRRNLEEKRDGERRDKLTKFWRKAAERLQKLINREKAMSQKIADRLERIQESGKDVTEQRRLLALADEAIQEAQDSLTNALTTLRAMVDDNDPVADIIATARELHKEVVGDIRVAHKALIDVIVSTRGISATPTPSPTATP